jgi:pSer/pThr/pTyr-binding forkhead associated (FHA) protein
VPDDTFVSQLHARLFAREDKLYLEDLGSTNGTTLNRKPVSAPVEIRRGDRIQVGKTVFEVVR